MPTSPQAPPRPSVSEDELRLERLRRQRYRYPLWRLIWANLHDDLQVLRRAWFSLSALLLVLTSGTFYLFIRYFPQRCAATGKECGIDLAQSLYETLQLLIFQSSLEFPSEPIGRLLFFATPLLGLFFLLQSAIDLSRLIFNKNSNPEQWQLSLAHTFSNHVIICGLGRVGYRTVLQLLETGYDVVVIEINWHSEFVATLLRLKVPVIRGDARDPDVLEQAGLGRARGLIAVINDDLKNIEIVLSARRSCSTIQTVLRIYNHELDTNLERNFGPNTAFCISDLAAPTFAAATVSREIAQVINLPEGMLGISEINVAPDSLISGFMRAIEDRYSVRILQQRDQRGREQRRGFIQKIEAGDSILCLGRMEDIEQLRLANQPHSKTGFLQPSTAKQVEKSANTIIVCGMGQVGIHVIRLLLVNVPHLEIVAICLPETPASIVDKIADLGVHTLCGDARDPQVLAAAGLDRAYTVASLYSNDLLNVQVGIAARAQRPDIHLVLRVFSDVLAERLSALFGINTAYSTSALAAPSLAAAAVLYDVGYALDGGEHLLATRTITVRSDDQFNDQPISRIRERMGLLIIALRRNGTAQTLPSLDTTLQPDDELVLLGDLSALAPPRKRG